MTPNTTHQCLILFTFPSSSHRRPHIRQDDPIPIRVLKGRATAVPVRVEALYGFEACGPHAGDGASVQCLLWYVEDEQVIGCRRASCAMGRVLGEFEVVRARGGRG